MLLMNLKIVHKNVQVYRPITRTGKLSKFSKLRRVDVYKNDILTISVYSTRTTTLIKVAINIHFNVLITNKKL